MQSLFKHLETSLKSHSAIRSVLDIAQLSQLKDETIGFPCCALVPINNQASGGDRGVSTVTEVNFGVAIIHFDGNQPTQQLLKIVEQVRSHLTGMIVEGFSPIRYRSGQINEIEANRLVWLDQFSTNTVGVGG